MIKHLAILTTFLVFTSFSYVETSCDIKNIYKSVEPEIGVKILTTDGEVEEAEAILIPIKIDEGKYKLSVTRKSSNLYKVDGKDIFIETTYCSEYANREDIILVVKSNYSYDRGEIIFTD